MQASADRHEGMSRRYGPTEATVSEESGRSLWREAWLRLPRDVDMNSAQVMLNANESADFLSPQAAGLQETPIVSVVIPTHNRPEETIRAVESARRQTFRDLEIIVVDDGSQDAGALQGQLERLNDRRIRFLAISPNRGANHARNRGVDLARGKFVAFLDSDDEWLPNKVSAQVAMFEDDPGRTVCSCRAHIRTTVGARVVHATIPSRLIGPDDQLDEYLFCHRGALLTPSLMLPRGLAIDNPFDESLPRHQELGFLLRLASLGVRFKMNAEPLVIVHWESLRTTQRHLNPQASNLFLSRYSQLMSARARCGFWCGHVVVPLFMAGRYRDGLRALLAKRKLLGGLVSMPRLAAQTGALALGIPIVVLQTVSSLLLRAHWRRLSADA